MLRLPNFSHYKNIFNLTANTAGWPFLGFYVILRFISKKKNMRVWFSDKMCLWFSRMTQGSNSYLLCMDSQLLHLNKMSVTFISWNKSLRASSTLDEDPQKSIHSWPNYEPQKNQKMLTDISGRVLQFCSFLLWSFHIYSWQIARSEKKIVGECICGPSR